MLFSLISNSTHITRFKKWCITHYWILLDFTARGSNAAPHVIFLMWFHGAEDVNKMATDKMQQLPVLMLSSEGKLQRQKAE